MKAIIIYASVHHGNTKKVIDGIARTYEVDLVDATKIKEKDLSEYDIIGFASGIYYGKYHPSVLKFASTNLPNNKDVFLLCTRGGKATYGSIKKIIESKACNIKGDFSCKGYDTFGPFKLFGGLAKGHPNEIDIENAIEFYHSLLS